MPRCTVRCQQTPSPGSPSWLLVCGRPYRKMPKLHCRNCVECPYAPAEVKAPQARLSSEGRTGRLPVRQSAQGPAGPRVGMVEICRLFNNPAGNHCRFPLCHYAHLCMKCRSPHPAAECGDKRRGGGRARSPPLHPTKS